MPGFCPSSVPEVPSSWLPGTFVQAALNEHATFALNPAVAETLHARVLEWEQMVHQYLESVFGLTWGEHVGWWVVNWFQNCIRYVPDKTMSAASRSSSSYGYPLFERELIHGGPDGERPQDEQLLPLVLGLLYAPSFASLVSSEMYGGGAFWPIWTLPWVGILGGISTCDIGVLRLQRSTKPGCNVPNAMHAR